MYVRAISKGDRAEADAILYEVGSQEAQPARTGLDRIDLQIKDRLERAGYTVVTNLGDIDTRITLAIYDSELDRYLLGIELDRDAFNSSKQAMERDISKPRFLATKGWYVLRIWSRDWWLYPAKTAKYIISEAERIKKENS